MVQIARCDTPRISTGGRNRFLAAKRGKSFARIERKKLPRQRPTSRGRERRDFEKSDEGNRLKRLARPGLSIEPSALRARQRNCPWAGRMRRARIKKKVGVAWGRPRPRQAIPMKFSENKCRSVVPTRVWAGFTQEPDDGTGVTAPDRRGRHHDECRGKADRGTKHLSAMKSTSRTRRISCAQDQREQRVGEFRVCEGGWTDRQRGRDNRGAPAKEDVQRAGGII